DMITLKIGFGAEFSDHLSIHRDKPAGDELFSFASRSDARCGNDFLQSFSGHIRNYSVPVAGVSTAAACSCAGSRSPWNDSATSFSNSSMLGSSLTSFNPKRSRNSLVVLYSIGRPMT